MALLGNKYDYLEDEQDLLDEYQIPAVFRKPKEFSLKKSIVLSTLLHPAVVGFAWLLLFVLTLLGINIALFDKPEPKPKDIEFVLVNKEATPINKHTKYRADRNSRAGGKHDPTKKVSMPQAPAPKAQSQAPSAPASPAKKVERKQVQQKTQPTQQKPAKTQSAPAAPKRNVVKPTQESFPTFAPRPTPRPSAPRPTVKPQSSFNIPVPKSSIPRVAAPSGGPITSSGNSNGSGSGESGSGAPSPSFSPTRTASGNGSGAGGGRFSGSKGSYGSGGSVGNPGPGNPHGAPGIDAIKEPDFGPYMRELQRQIKRNWEPPKGNESKRVVLLFSISRDGRLLSMKVLKSSGVAAADAAARQAVQLTAPFRPLPPEYKGSNVDIQFTFDYNVFGASRY